MTTTLSHVALVSQTPSLSLARLTAAAAAIQKQVSRDFGPIWGIDATVAAYDKLRHVPVGYWSIVVKDAIGFDAAGIHLNHNDGQPFALVEFSDNWAQTISHECLEMLADPFGNRTISADSVKPGQGRVKYLVEVCDPSEATEFGYSINGILVSDFYTPHFFDPVVNTGVRYSFTGAISRPRQVLDGGYLSWFDPASNHLFQLIVQGKNRVFKDLGALPGGFALREFADRNSAKFRLPRMRGKKSPLAGMLTAAAVGDRGKETELDASMDANGDQLQAQIDRVIASAAKAPAKGKRRA